MTTAIVAAMVATALAVRPPQLARLRAVSRRDSPAEGRREGGSRWWRSPWLPTALATLAVIQMVGGITGVVVGLACGVAVRRWVSGTEPAESRRSRALIEREVPLAVDLLVACVASGRPPGAALVTVADALPGLVADRLRPVTNRLSLGADAELVWRDLAADPPFAPLGHTLARSTRTGASVTTALTRCADDLRRQRRSRAETVARSVGVRSAAPLGACFLPAFLLIGVVPTIVGAFGTLSV